MMDNKVALVTGGNRGIGFEICRQLGKAGFLVILAARDEQKGNDAAKKLREEGLNVSFELLEVGNEKGTNDLAQIIKQKYNRLDVLVNNAGVLPNSNNIETALIGEVKQVFDTNFFGVILLVQAFLPMLKSADEGRIINIASGMGAFNEMGAGHLAYRTSKTALNGLTMVLSKDLANTNIKVNSMCPGWVQTDMGGMNAPRSVQQGADTAFWLATATNIETGKFYRDRHEIAW